MNGGSSPRTFPLLLGLCSLLVAVKPVPAQEGFEWLKAVEAKSPSTPELTRKGEEIYRRACFYCHGLDGRGHGMALRYLFTMPRDFTAGKFKLRTTPTGSLPADEDLFRTITVGIPEYGMPRFAYLSPTERWALVYYLKTFSPRFRRERARPPVLPPPGPPVTPELLAQGRDLFLDAECWKCHGQTGKGDGPSAPDLRDDWERLARLPDLTRREEYKGGARARDIVRTLLTGLTGAAMPSFEEVFTDEQLWALAYYIESLASGKNGADR